MKRAKINSIIGIFLIVIIFILFSYLIQDNLAFFQSYLDLGIMGMLIFVIIVILSIVLAPISSVPLFPLATGLWGWVIAGILGVIGWTIGAIIAFMLARRYGVSLVSKFLPMRKIYQFENKIPDKNLFWTVVFFRMVIPVDGLSYLLGLFSKMSLRSYSLATFIGLIPFSFGIAYIGSMPIQWMIFFMTIATLIFAIGLTIAYYRKKDRGVGKS